MLDILRAWLNGKRPYPQGVVIYAIVGKDPSLLKLFKGGETPFTSKRLQDELMRICKEMKAGGALSPSAAKEKATPPPTRKATEHPAAVQKIITTKSIAPAPEPEDEQCANPELYATAKKEADLAYKACMNKRAELFAMCRSLGYEDLNRPDLVEQRAQLSLQVVIEFNRVSELYDRAEQVRISGSLPNTEEPEENEYDALPDTLVKAALYNLKQNYNRIRKREHTAERVALLQKHERNIKKLEERWRLLKPKV